MDIFFLILIPFCPLCIPTAYIAHQKQSPYPLIPLAVSAAAGVFLCGTIETGVSAILQTALNTAAYTGLVRWWTAALTEETIKLLLFYIIAKQCGIFGRRDSMHTQNVPAMQCTAYPPETDRNSIITSCAAYALFFGFAFGGFETLSYTIRYRNSLPYRITSAAVLHGTLTSFYCTFYTLIRRYPPQNRMYRTTKCLACIGKPILLHGFYNMFSALGGIFTLLAYTIVLVSCLNTARTFKNTPIDPP